MGTSGTFFRRGGLSTLVAVLPAALALAGCRLPAFAPAPPPATAPRPVYVAPLLVQRLLPGAPAPAPDPSLALQLAAWEELEAALLTRPDLFRPLALPQDAATGRLVQAILAAPQGGLFPNEIPRAIRQRLRDGTCLAYGIADLARPLPTGDWQARVQLTWVEDGATGHYTRLAGSGAGATPRQAIRQACDALLLKLPL